MMSSYLQHPSSYRDPSGFVFESSGKLFRQINNVYREHYELLMSSGLYQTLVEKEWLISHAEITSPISTSSHHFKTISPEYIPFITYPYEWCFEQLKDAALLTLGIMKVAIDHGLILKDATPFNIQFRDAQPVHIDTLSFEKYDDAKPWVAYRQFCETFLYPLLVEKYTSLEIHRLFAAYPQGISAKETVYLLPAKSRFHLGNWLHVFLPASIRAPRKNAQATFTRNKLLRIVDHLQQFITNLRTSSQHYSTWKNYYDKDILSKEYLSGKQTIIKELIKVEGKQVLDLGCNQGIFSRLLSEKGNSVVAVDNDAFSISVLYRNCREERSSILPLCVDLTDPPGNAGFMNEERKSFSDRLKFDLCISLALLHHLAIGKNIPFGKLADFLSAICNELIIEFVPKDDEKVQQLLAAREDIFDWYCQANFENVFGQRFIIEETQQVPASKRIIYRMKKRAG
jgi:SAM-dependent methyltransferase